MNNFLKKRLSPYISLMLLSISFSLLCFQQDPVLKMVCPHIKEGKDLDKVIEILNNDLKNRPWNHDVRLYLSIAYFKKGDNETASELIKKISEQVEALSGSNRPLVNVSDTSQESPDRESGDVADALRFRQKRERGVLSQENLGLFYFTDGILLKLKGKSKDAEKRFKAAIKAGYEESAARLQLIDLYIATNNIKAADKEVSKFAKISKDKSTIHFLKGYMYYQNNKAKEARSSFEKALSLNPDFLMAKKNIALLEYNAGNYQKAIEILQEIIQKHPSDKDAHINLGRAYYHNGELKKAEQEFHAVEITIAVDKYSPKKIPLLTLELSKELTFKLIC
jgi:tetratricopeptide (TPR) repeat protein